MSDLFDFLADEDIDEEAKSRVLKDLDTSVDFESPDGEVGSPRAAVDIPTTETGERVVRLRLVTSPVPDDSWTLDPADDHERPDPDSSQVLALVRAPNEEPKALSSETLVESCAHVPGLGERVATYLESRRQLVRSWNTFRLPPDTLIQTLVAQPELLRYVQAYLGARHEMVVAATAGSPKPDAAPRTILALLDADWDWDPNAPTRSLAGPYAEARTSPIHPWRLQPLADIARRVLYDNKSGLGARVNQARWAVDRAVPAFNSLSTASSLLYYAGEEDGALLFTSRVERVLPPSGDEYGSLRRTVESFVQLHPWCEDGMAVTLVNPPAGTAVTKFVRWMRTRFNSADLVVRGVYEKATSDVEEYADETLFDTSVLVESVPQWLATPQPASHVAFYFLETLPGEIAGSHDSVSGPGGAYVRIALVADEGPVDPDRPFTVNRVPKVVVSPDDRNQCVADHNGLVGRGDDLAALEFPLRLPDDDLEGIQRLSSTTEWLAVGLPGMASGLRLDAVDGSVVQLGRLELGPYTLLVLAPGLQPLRHWLVDMLKGSPVFVSLAALEERLRRLAVRHPAKLLELAVNKHGGVETLGLLLARSVLRPGAEDRLVVEVPMDSTGWTRYWLPAGQRCDLIQVQISREADDPHPIRLVAVEAKARTGQFRDTTDDLFTEAAAQVSATIASLKDLLSPAGGDLVGELRFRGFCEQLFALAAATDDLRLVDDDDEGVLQNLTRVAERDFGDEVTITGLVVACWLGSAHPIEYEYTTSPDGIGLVSATGGTLSAALEREIAPSLDDAEAESVRGDQTEGQSKPTVPESPTGGGTDDQHEVDATGEAQEPAPAGLDSQGGPEPEPEAEVQDLARRIALSARRYSEDVGPSGSGAMEVGPTFVSVSLPLAPGGQIQVLERNTANIAREVGTGALDVENDPSRRYHVRFLALRSDREFPKCPPIQVHDSVRADSYLALAIGQDLRGEDIRVAISTWPHALVAGTTGSGKTTFLRSIASQVGSLGRERARIVIVDGKGEADFLGVVPDDVFVEQFSDVLLDAGSSLSVLEWLFEQEIPRRKAYIRDRARETGARFDCRMEYVDAVQAGTPSALQPILASSAMDDALESAAVSRTSTPAGPLESRNRFHRRCAAGAAESSKGTGRAGSSIAAFWHSGRLSGRTIVRPTPLAAMERSGASQRPTEHATLRRHGGEAPVPPSEPRPRLRAGPKKACDLAARVYVGIHSSAEGTAWLSGKMELSGFEPPTSRVWSRRSDQSGYPRGLSFPVS